MKTIEKLIPKFFNLVLLSKGQRDGRRRGACISSNARTVVSSGDRKLRIQVTKRKSLYTRRLAKDYDESSFFFKKKRLILRCRQEARGRFAKMRSDVIVKLELLEQKHSQFLAQQLQKLMRQFNKFYEESQAILKDNKLFPIEIDLPKTSLELESELQTQQSAFSEYQDEENEQKSNSKDEDDLIEPELLAEFNEFQLGNESNLINF